jgi:hypothetical protein
MCLLMGNHALAIEAQARRAVRGRCAVVSTRSLRHFCRTVVESEMHTLFDCTSSAAVAALRDNFLALIENQVRQHGTRYAL